MSDAIELHDSDLRILDNDEGVLLRLCPAYVHHWTRVSGVWIGEGRSQDVEIEVGSGRLVQSYSQGVSTLSGGWIAVDGRRFDNMIPASLHGGRAVEVGLELQDGSFLEIHGLTISVRLVGDAKFVEHLPLDFAPTDDAG
jgi:hypothetical protein